MTDTVLEAVREILRFGNAHYITEVKDCDAHSYVAAFPSICSFVMEWENGDEKDKKGSQFAHMLWLPLMNHVRQQPSAITQEFVEAAVKLIGHWCKQADENTNLQEYQKTGIQYMISLIQNLSKTGPELVSMFAQGMAECLFVNDADLRGQAASIISSQGELPPKCASRIFSRMRESSEPPVQALGALSPRTFKRCKENILTNVDILVTHGLAQQNQQVMQLLQAIVNERPHALIPYMEEIIDYTKVRPSDHWVWQLLCVISAAQPEAPKKYLNEILIAADEIPQLTYPIARCLANTGIEDEKCARRVLTFLMNKIENTWDPEQLLMLVKQFINISEWQPNASQPYVPLIKSMVKHRDWDIRQLVNKVNE